MLRHGSAGRRQGDARRRPPPPTDDHLLPSVPVLNGLPVLEALGAATRRSCREGGAPKARAQPSENAPAAPGEGLVGPSPFMSGHRCVGPVDPVDPDELEPDELDVEPAGVETVAVSPARLVAEAAGARAVARPKPPLAAAAPMIPVAST